MQYEVMSVLTYDIEVIQLTINDGLFNIEHGCKFDSISFFDNYQSNTVNILSLVN